MAGTSTNTPGFAGYLLAWAVTDLLFIGGIVGSMIATEEDWGLVDPIGWLVLVGFFTAVFSVPFAVAGILLVHLLCRGIPQQWVHVLIAAFAGAFAGATPTFPGGGLNLFVLVVAACAALGRAAVIPLVHERRRRDSLPSAVRC